MARLIQISCDSSKKLLKILIQLDEQRQVSIFDTREIQEDFDFILGIVLSKN